jgi:hypothetical protein
VIAIVGRKLVVVWKKKETSNFAMGSLVELLLLN